MKILIVSDTHGYEKNLSDVIKKEGKIDKLIHLGDYEDGKGRIFDMVTCPIEIVKGNNDYSSDETDEKLIRIGKYNVFLTHGHKFRIHYSEDTLYYKALSVGADIVLFGHTHVPVVKYVGGVLFANPGSISQPRQDNRKPSYIVMEIKGEKEPDLKIKYC